MNILLITGGWSTERDVALTGGRGIKAALERLGHTVSVHDPVDSLKGLAHAAKGKDFAFISLHGSPGEDGLIQSILERTGCPYQGSGPAGSQLAVNKAAAKVLFDDIGLVTADWRLLTQKPAPGTPLGLPCPVFIKANTGGSSLHMERVAAPEDLDAALERLFSFGGEYIAECAVNGAEVTCGVLARPDGAGGEVPEALPPVLIRPKSSAAFFDYTEKYSADGAEEICPAPLPAETTAEVQRMALAAHEALGLAGYSRSDFIVTPEGVPYILEVNTLPGMTPKSLLPQEAAAAGMDFDSLIARLVELGINRAKGRKPV